MGGDRVACVVGANGFIGKKAAEALAGVGFRVRAGVRRPADPLPEELRAIGAEVVAADVTDPAALARAVEGAELVVNCCGIYRWWVPDPREYERVNVAGSANVARACLASASTTRLVHVSTAMAFGYPAERPFTECSAPGPHASAYAETKHRGDVEVERLTRDQSKLAVATLFLGCVTGPGDTFATGRPAAVYRDFMQGKIPMLFAPETNYIYVHIKDVQQAISAAATLDAPQIAGQRFLIGNSAGMITTKQYFEIMSRHTGRPCPAWTLNVTIGYWLAWLVTWVSTHLTGAEPLLPLDVMRTARWGSIEYDCTKSIKVLGVSYTPIEVAVAEAMRDVQARLADKSASKTE